MFGDVLKEASARGIRVVGRFDVEGEKAVPIKLNTPPVFGTFAAAGRACLIACVCDPPSVYSLRRYPP
jgi:hypothetical protein